MIRDMMAKMQIILSESQMENEEKTTDLTTASLVDVQQIQIDIEKLLDMARTLVTQLERSQALITGDIITYKIDHHIIV